MISLHDISKSYGAIRAVDNFSLEVENGSLFGLIGPDGAGKSTIFRILSTLLLPDTGRAFVNNWDCAKDYAQIRAHIGYMPGRFSLYKDLSVEENLHFFATIFGTTVKENYGLIKDIYEQLEPFKTRRAGKLSGGMKQKLALCCALVHKPLVLFLDEPTTRVDAVSRKEFWEMLKRLQASGLTILVSTPYMDEATRCDRIGLLQEGRLLQTGSPAEISASYPSRLYAIRSENVFALLNRCREFPGIVHADAFGEAVHLSFKDDNNSNQQTQLLYVLEQSGLGHFTIEQIEPGIEDIFLHFLLTENG